MKLTLHKFNINFISFEYFYKSRQITKIHTEVFYKKNPLKGINQLSGFLKYRI